MSSYTFTRSRIFQWMGILFSLGIIAVGYWYWRADAGMKTNVTATGSLTSGLVGYWTFDGADVSGTTATDRGSGANNGTLTNGPTVTPGKLGQALSFDGSNDEVNVTSTTLSTTYTVSAWIKTNTIAENNAIFVERQGGNPVLFQMDHDSDDARFIVRDDSGVSGAASLANVLTTGTWYHLVGVRNGNTLSMYVNGVKGTDSTASFGAISAGTRQIGDSDHLAGGNFNGLIDEVRVYNAALTAVQIQSLYAQGASDPVNSSASQPQGTGRLDSGLAGYWAMDDGSGTSATDSSTNANTGTLTSGPTWTTGQIGGAVNFDGTDDYISIGDQTIYEMNGSKTISLWFKASVNPADREFLVTKGTSTNTDYEWELSINGGNSDKLRFSIYQNDSLSAYIYADSTTSIDTSGSVWYQVTAVYLSGTPTISVYLNGALEGSSTSTTGSIETGDAASLLFGKRGDNAETEFSGLMDEVRVYNRALSADEVADLYRLTTPTGVDTSLKGYWSFNGKDVSGTTAYDRSGAGNTGTLTNGPTVTPGKVGQALSFDGSNDYIAVSSSSALNPTTAITLSAWVKRGTTGVRQFILSKGDFGFASTTQYWLEFTSADLVTFGFHNSTNAYTISSPSAITDSNWHHIVATYDSTTRRLYIDGVQVNSAALALSINSNSGEFTIGTSATSHGSPYSGSIDEVRIYNTALSAAQIKAFYDQGASDEQNTGVSQPQGTGRLDSGLAGYWRMDDGSGTSATDSSTNGNTGTLTNGPTWTTGQIGGAVSLDATNDYVTMGDVVEPENITIAAWVNSNSTSGAQAVILKGSSYGGAEQYSMLINYSAGGYFDFYFGTGAGVWDRCRSSTTYTAGQWYHVVGTYNGVSCKVYMDGVDKTVVTTDTGSGPIKSGSAALTFGTSAGGNFLLDEARIYNRALSADEVANLYRLTTPTGTETGLKAYLSFNGKDMSGTSAYDRSGAGNTGTTSGSPSVTPGKVGQGLAFDGSDDYVSIADTSSIDYDYTQDFSFAVWVKLPSTQTDTSGGDNFIIEKWSSSGGYPYALRLYNQTYGTSGDRGKVVFRRYDGTNSPGVTSTTLLNDNNWHHVVGTKSGSQLRLYVDGASQATATDTTTTTTTNTSPLYIGTRGGSTNNLTGSVDELRIYNRTLSAAEVAALYNNR